MESEPGWSEEGAFGERSEGGEVVASSLGGVALGVESCESRDRASVSRM